MSAPSKVALLAFALDPGLFAEYCLPEIEPWQKEIVRNRGNDLILAHRQRGKSTGVAIKVLWEMLFMPYSFTLLFSASEGQAAELFRKMLVFYQPFRKAFPPEQESELRVRIPGGNRVLVMPSKAASIRGYSAVSRLVLDEAVEVKNELYYVSRPMLLRTRIPGGGKISAMSNAGFDDGWFYDEFTEGGTMDEETACTVEDEWRRQFIPYATFPAYSEKFVTEETEKIGPERWEREFGCRFTRLKGMQAGGFSREVVESAFDEAIKPMEWGD